LDLIDKPQQSGPAPASRTGRNLPLATAVGAALGAGALATLLTVKATFLIYMGAALALSLRELHSAVRAAGINFPAIPVLLGGAGMLTCAYWLGGNATVAAFTLTVLAVLAWRMTRGTTGYVRDVTMGIFAAAWLPLLGATVAGMLSASDGGRRVLVFIIITICSDIGGYFAGIGFGKHKLAPSISPKKTWEGLAGSLIACLAAGGLTVPLMLHHGHVWQGLLVGAAVTAAAICGDLVESIIKRDLDIKDMGALLPGHGGILDRIDSLLFAAPVVWLLLMAFNA
jgi:phosphatidate cytidylyltransferase